MCCKQAVFHIPTTEEDEPTSSIPLALQTLFYQVRIVSPLLSAGRLLLHVCCICRSCHEECN